MIYIKSFSYILVSFILSAVVFLGSLQVAFAHSTVSPSQTTTSTYETFLLSVPTERDVPTTAVRLLIPESLDRVTPFVKPGWDITTTKEGERVTQIEWTGGSVPTGQKDTFEFTARTGVVGDTLVWKVYQTYAGGEVVAWDRDPSMPEANEEKVANPYSKTEVIDDSIASAPSSTETNNSTLPFYISLLALALSVAAVGISVRHKS